MEFFSGKAITKIGGKIASDTVNALSKANTIMNVTGDGLLAGTTSEDILYDTDREIPENETRSIINESQSQSESSKEDE